MASPTKSPSDSIVAETLACTNCEDPTPKIECWCIECFKEEKGRIAPVALCQQCNIGLHANAKMSLHRRQPFRCNTDKMPSAAELKLPAAFPAGFPSLCALMCSNCEVLLDELQDAQWCLECLLILCKGCSKDLHAPQKKKLHQRFPFDFRFISSAHLGDENGTIAEAQPQTGRTLSSASSSFSASSSSGVTAMTQARAAPAIPLSASATSSPALKVAALGLMKTANLLAHLGKKKKEDKTNPGIPGDVMQISEPALTGVIECTLHSFKNTFNDFDTIGTVQIVQICCGNKHAGAVTAGGSLFMWSVQHPRSPNAVARIELKLTLALVVP
jgi:hypothetical protein